jgi:hypothetical protein
MSSTPQTDRRDLKQCPRCGTTMFLARIMAKFGPLPEMRRYRCPECRCVVEEEQSRWTFVAPEKFAGLADWLGQPARNSKKLA